LGRWDATGGRYIGGKGELTLVMKDGRHVTHGKKMDKHLYKMDVTTKKPSVLQQTDEMFINEPKTLSWETWHRRYGHVRYSGLQKILEGKMVDGFNVDDDSNASGLMCTANTKTNTQTNARGPRECPKRPVYEMR
jgi:hypothetical protein